MDNNILNKRTAGEWKLHNNKPFLIVGKHGAICDMKNTHSDESAANAAFIVKAVNNYDSLLEALKNCVVVMERARNILSGKDGGNWGYA